MTALAIGPQPLTRADVIAVARHRIPVRLTDEARAEMAKSREIVEALADGDEPTYGISTGFGALATRSSRQVAGSISSAASSGPMRREPVPRWRPR